VTAISAGYHLFIESPRYYRVESSECRVEFRRESSAPFRIPFD